MNQRNLTILGSTGSIGTQALEIVEEHPESFHVLALSAHSSWKLLADQANRFRPDYLHLSDGTFAGELTDRLKYKPAGLTTGTSGLSELAAMAETDIVLNSLVGFIGFMPTYAALEAGNTVALANKESLVAGGELIAKFIEADPGCLIPVDSEHSAMLQCLVGEDKKWIERIVITASGGPFWDWTEERMAGIRVEDALAHPNWSMGAKITIDSSTLMNKGLEIIEAHWLFDLPLERIEPVIHPQSIIHSIVEFADGSSKAQLGPPDMKVPILYALSYPDRLPLSSSRMDWTANQSLTFEPVDYKRFPCLKLALEAAETGGHSPAVMNAANEIAVERFLKKEIAYIEIAKIVEASLQKLNSNTELTPDSLYEVDREARSFAQSL